MLGYCDDNLWLDRSVSDAGDDFILNLHVGPTGRLDDASIGDTDVAFVVDGLARQIHEIARANAGLGRDEQAAGRGFENGYIEDIANPEHD